MSISKLLRARVSKAEMKRNAISSAYVLPPTVSRDTLLERGSDHRFRVLVQDLLTIASRMELVREHLGGLMQISGPQYSLMVAIAHMQGVDGVNVGAVARALHVSSAFIASESGKLARKGLLSKRTSPHDRRGVLLSVTPAGRKKIDGISKRIRTVNDLFFGILDSASFAAVSTASGALVESSVRAIQYLNAVEAKPAARRRGMSPVCARARQGVPTKRACDNPRVWQRRTNSVE
jgi:DNA-binding MarR family transcriptional regulator